MAADKGSSKTVRLLSVAASFEAAVASQGRRVPEGESKWLRGVLPHRPLW